MQISLSLFQCLLNDHYSCESLLNNLNVNYLFSVPNSLKYYTHLYLFLNPSSSYHSCYSNHILLFFSHLKKQIKNSKLQVRQNIHHHLFLYYYCLYYSLRLNCILQMYEPTTNLDQSEFIAFFLICSCLKINQLLLMTISFKGHVYLSHLIYLHHLPSRFRNINNHIHFLTHPDHQFK